MEDHLQKGGYILGFSTILLGLIGFSGSLGVKFFPGKIRDSTELPMTHFSGAVFDREGFLYWGSTFFGRIQVYDPDGKFQHGWQIDTAMGSFRLDMNQNNHLEVATARNDLRITFNRMGEILNKSEDPEAFREFPAPKNKFEDPGGAIYEIFGPGMFKTDQAEEKVLIGLPVYKWVLAGGIMSWSIALLGGVIIFVTTVFSEKKTIPGLKTNDSQKKLTRRVLSWVFYIVLNGVLALIILPYVSATALSIFY